ncbi:hypothetical protein AFLA_005754 [Aspergillus flavus NRRL3357]|nr:hypothetical protein AFLA_005754 [Aspergillus flavus NRRL3357]
MIAVQDLARPTLYTYQQGAARVLRLVSPRIEATKQGGKIHRASCALPRGHISALAEPERSPSDPLPASMSPETSDSFSLLSFTDSLPLALLPFSTFHAGRTASPC